MAFGVEEPAQETSSADVDDRAPAAVSRQDAWIDGEPARVMFVGRSIGHFTYYDSVLTALCNRGAEVELLLDRKWSAKWLRGLNLAQLEAFSARHPNFRFAWLTRRQDGWRDNLFDLRELRTYRSYLTRPETTPFYIGRWRVLLRPSWRRQADRPWFDALVRSPLTEAVIRLVEQMSPADPAVVQRIRAFDPHVVICSPMNLRFSEETDYAKAAKKLGIPLAAITISWDNLSTKGLFHIEPDTLFVWNRYQLEDALTIQKIPRDKLSVAGSPFFDKWFSDEPEVLERRAFCRIVGLDAKRPILLYLGSSQNIAADESWFVRKVKEYFATSGKGGLDQVQILIRPHPANAKVFRKLETDDVKIWPKGGVLPESDEEFRMMRSSFAHSVGVLGINTSAMIDSVLADKPTFTVKLKRYVNTQANAVHFRYLEEAGALTVCTHIGDLTLRLRDLMRGQDTKRAERRAFARSFARPEGLERSAGDVIAGYALTLARARAARMSS